MSPIGVALTASAACAAPADVARPGQVEGYGDFDAMKQDFLVVVDELEWPPEWDVSTPHEPAHEQLPDGTMVGALYQEGAGRSAAYDMWWCAWAQEWLEVVGLNDAEAAYALEVMGTWTSLPEIDLMWDPGSTHVVYAGYLVQAEAGDDSGLVRHVVLNCGS